MKKTVVVLFIAAALLILVPMTASAVSQPYFHGDFNISTTGCGQCHVTHAAGLPSLLLDTGSTTVGSLCLYCHNDLTRSPYDAWNGKIATPTGIMPSVAGGMGSTFNFDNPSLTYDEDPVTGGDNPDNYVGSTSAHYEQYERPEYLVFGGTQKIGAQFTCISCHDPHTGGTYPVNSTGRQIMPRLLRTKLYTAVFNPTDFNDWTFSPDGESRGYHTKVVTGYGEKIGFWCAGCHDLFNRSEHDAGITVVTGTVYTNNQDLYMHRVNFPLSDGGVARLGSDNTISKMPLAKNNYLTCLTCHRVHGTGSTMTDIIFNRANSYFNNESSGDPDSETSNSSALLREKDREVCYKCHGEADYNTPHMQDH